MNTIHLAETIQLLGASGTGNVEIKDFSGTGRGLAATKKFNNSSQILSVPLKWCWSATSAKEHPLLGTIVSRADISDDDCLAVLLMYYSHKSFSKLSNNELLALGNVEQLDYIRSLHASVLPTEYTNSIFYSDDDLDKCYGSSLFNISTVLKNQIKEDYMNLLMNVFSQNSDTFPLSDYTLEKYMWALCTIWSRCMDFFIPQSTGTSTHMRCLVPFMDLFNGSLSVSQCHQYDIKTNSIQVIAGKDYQPGDQVFINYGIISNSRLLRLYGFVMQDNINDNFELVLSTHPLSPLYDEKVRIFKRFGMDPNSTFLLTKEDPMPVNVLQYLRIQRANDDEIQAVGNVTGVVSLQNELEILNALQEAITAILSNFAFTIQQLHDMIATMEPGSPSWNCSIVSISEQTILSLSLSKCRDLIAAYTCGHCKKSQLGLKKCAKCHQIGYCDRQCQLADWNQHKQVCNK
ncbi:hypothetical protein BC833DRAFT_596970 [Globomyces pollinis-pini]|nr:hypothetical protein BC833DRAFT_596970 [Globomyces pollinis-pini]